jgi:hypothetical protein
MYARNNSGPSTLHYGTPDFTLTSFDNCPSTLTLCVRPKRNSLVHTTTFESTTKAAIFVSSTSFKLVRYLRLPQEQSLLYFALVFIFLYFQVMFIL